MKRKKNRHYTIVSISNDNWIASTIRDEIIPQVHLQLDNVNHIGLSLKLWYGRSNNENIGQYSKYYTVPRVGKNMQDWWHDSRIIDDYLRSSTKIITQIRNIISTDKPDLLLLADDTGPIETMIIKLFNNALIPVVLLEHGYGEVLPLNLIKKFENKGLFLLKNFSIPNLLIYLKSRYYQLTSKINFCVPIYTNSFGFNGDCNICTYSKISTNKLIRMGIDKEKITETGFPYWDKIFDFAATVRPYRRNGEKKLKVLFISSGLGKFNFTQDDKLFYSKMLSAIKELHNLCKIYLRIKPGENLSKKTSTLLKKYDVNIVENIKPSYKQIIAYDAVIGSRTTVLLESAALGIPVFDLKYFASNKVDYFYSEVLQKYLKIKRIDKTQNIYSTISNFANEKYGRSLAQNFRQNSRILVNGFDGMSGYRVARLVNKLIMQKSNTL